MKDRTLIRIATALTFCTFCVALPQVCSCQGKTVVHGEAFGTDTHGRSVELYTIRNSHGLEVRAVNYGGIIVSLRVPDRNGNSDDIVLGFDQLQPYLEKSTYFGAIIGRYANRIAGGKFKLDGTDYLLAINNGPNSLHGGLKGFDKVVWKATSFENVSDAGIIFSYVSKAGEEGYPGTLTVKVTYTITDQDEVIFDYEATTDKATPVNLTQHSFFNLAGDGKRDVLGHVLMLNADRFTPVDKNLIPTGELRAVKKTPMDFTKPTAIGQHIDDNDEQLIAGHGYDHNFVINREDNGLALAARVYEPSSGRVMEVRTTEPGVQFYSGNFLDGTVTGKHGHVYKRRYGLCLETQHFPDSPNHPAFPSTILRPAETYRSRTIYKFSVDMDKSHK